MNRTANQASAVAGNPIGSDGLLRLIYENRVPEHRTVPVTADLAADLDATGALKQALPAFKYAAADAVTDAAMQAKWHLPANIRRINAASMQRLLNDRNDAVNGGAAGRERIGREFAAFERAGLLDILRLVLHFAETCRKHGQVIGVGRGSAVSSYVLFLLGAHRVNPLAYGLDFAEFMREATPGNT